MKQSAVGHTTLKKILPEAYPVDTPDSSYQKREPKIAYGENKKPEINEISLIGITAEHPELLVNNTSPLEKMMKMRGYHAEDIYYSEPRWREGHLPACILQEILCWSDGKGLNDKECLTLYNNWFIPIWNYISHKNIKMSARESIASTDQKLADSKAEYIDIFWLLYNCLAIPELNFGIKLTPREKHK